MTPTDLLSAIRAALDETERDAASEHELGCAVTDPAYEDPPRDADLTDIATCSCSARDRLRLVAAMREIVAEHLPATAGVRVVCSVCADPPAYEARWHDYPCPTIRALAGGAGIDPEETG